MNARVLPDAEALARASAELVLEAEAAAGERFAICLTGGSTPQATHRLLASDEYRGRADWSRWHVFLGDERRVPLDDPRSNYQNARESLLDHVPIPAGQIHPLTDADQYEGLLRAFFGEAPRFDLLMLGMGDDGHTASLFPGSVSLLESERWVIAPPDVVQGMSRLTLTLPALDAARRTVFLVAGAAKADPIRRISAGEQLPAGMVRGAEWLLDEAAALSPRDARIEAARANVYERERRLPEALVHARQAVLLSPFDVELARHRLSLVMALQRWSELDSALEQLKTALRQGGNNVTEVHLAASQAHAARGNLARAVLELKTTATLDARNPAIWAAVGRTSEAQGDLTGAVAAFRQVIALKPGDTEATEALTRVERAKADARLRQMLAPAH